MKKVLVSLIFVFCSLSRANENLDVVLNNGSRTAKVILSDTFIEADGEVFPVKGPWVSLHVGLYNGDQKAVITKMRLKVVNEIIPTIPTVIETDFGFSRGLEIEPFQDYESTHTINSLLGSNEKLELDKFLGTRFDMKVTIIGYTLDENGAADGNIVVSKYITGLSD